MLFDLLSTLRFCAVLGCGLLLPGWLLGRALGVPGGPAGAFLGSAALLTNLVVLLDALGVRLDLPRLSVAMGLACVTLLLVSRRRPRTPGVSGPNSLRPHWRWQAWQWLLIPAGLGLLGIIVRATVEPLNGWDTSFRWDYLAREMIHTGNLRFYPAVTARDFQHYDWPDGIAPLVSSLYAWAYLSLGRMDSWVTIPVVVGEATLLFYLVGRLASVRSGPVGGAVAVALLALSPVFLWGVAMGQETAMTALSTVAMFWFIEQARPAGKTGWTVWAGLAAGTGALAREYALVLIPLGGLALVWWRLPRRSWLTFMLAAAAVALPWYLRNWLKTGNPLYPLDLGGLFPTTAVYAEWSQALARLNRVTDHPGHAVPLLLKLGALLAGVPLVVGAISGLSRWRSHAPWLVAAAIFLGLWVWSVGYTAGGYVYSMRTLTPAIALTAVLGGIGVARWVSGRHMWILAGGLTAAAAISAQASLFLPLQVFPRWWQDHFTAWHDLAVLSAPQKHSPNWTAIVSAAEGRQILVSDPNVGRTLRDHGAHTVPLFSPEVRFLFESPVGLDAGAARLRAAGYRFVLLTRGNLINDNLLRAHPFFVELQATPPVAAVPSYFLYDLYAAAQRRDDSAPPARAP